MSEQNKQTNPETEPEIVDGASEPLETTESPIEQETEISETEKLQKQIETLNDRLLRTMAEYDNFRRRSQREKEAIYPQATATAVSCFVPILDTFDRALNAPCADGEFKKGVEMILTNFKEVLTKLGVEEFSTVGEAFNPEMHNAVMHIEDSNLGTNVIAEVFQPGYRMGDRIIRHAMVKVAN